MQGTADGPLRVVLTLRGDFYGRALEDRTLADRLQGAVVNVAPLLRAELERTIREPAAKVGLGFDDGLVPRILDDVAEEPGSLPLLEFLLEELWKQRDRDGQLTHSAYDALGGVKGAIAARAQAELDRILKDLGTDKEAVARAALVRLVTPGEGQDDTRAARRCPKPRAWSARSSAASPTPASS